MITFANDTLNTSEFEKIMHFFPDGLVSIDLETTGLSPLVDQIIEIAAIKVTSQGVEVFQTLIDPGIEIPAHTIAIHNITNEMVVGAPKLRESLLKLNNFIGSLPLVAHNAKFDAGFIVMGLEKTTQKLGVNEVYCSCKLSRQTHAEMANHKLSTLVAALNIPLLNHHRATDDAIAGLKVFIHSLTRIETQVEDLRRHGLIFKLDDFGKLAPVEIPEKLKELEKLVKEASIIEIMYSGGNLKNQFRPVKLTSLLNTPEGNILYARCLLSDMQKSFKLKKITELRHPSALEIQKWLQK